MKKISLSWVIAMVMRLHRKMGEHMEWQSGTEPESQRARQRQNWFVNLCSPLGVSVSWLHYFHVVFMAPGSNFMFSTFSQTENNFPETSQNYMPHSCAFIMWYTPTVFATPTSEFYVWIRTRRSYDWLGIDCPSSTKPRSCLKQCSDFLYRFSRMRKEFEAAPKAGHSVRQMDASDRSMTHMAIYTSS